MSDFILWANENNGFLTLLLTCVSAVSTATAVVVSLCANKISAKNLKQAMQIEKDRNRPYVIFDIQHNKSLLHAKLKNIGQTAAINVSLKIEPELATSWVPSLSLPKNKISFLAPDRTLLELIGTGPGFFEKYKDPKFSGELNYSDSSGETYTEKFFLDLTYMKEFSFADTPDIARELQKLVGEVRAVSRRIIK